MMISFGIKDVIDILLVALLLFYVYRLMRNSGSLSLFFGVLAYECSERNRYGLCGVSRNGKIGI